MIEFEINGRKIGKGYPCYIIAEMSANHSHNYDTAVKILHTAKDIGADAVKVQTYTADTLTINCNNEYFQIGEGTIWEGKNLYQLYKEAYTPWEWQPELKKEADKIGIDFFSTPFDNSSVDFLEEMDVPAYKIASFEIVDLPLIKYVASKGKPVIMSTGMATLEEIKEAVETVYSTGNKELALLKCTSAYPAKPEEMNLNTIPDMAAKFSSVVGLSDHTLGSDIPIAARSLGASIIEKHLTLDRNQEGPDSKFSTEPEEFKDIIDSIRKVEAALGVVNYQVSDNESASRIFRRSLFIVKDVKKGDVASTENIRSIRPGHGIAPKYIDEIIGKKFTTDLSGGTPLSLSVIE